MTIRAAHVVAPVFAAPKVVAFFFAGMAGQTGFGNFLRRLVLERDDLGWVTFLDVGLARAMTRFAPGYFSFPTAYLREIGVRGMRERFELILVAGLASLTADVIIVIIVGRRETREIIGGTRETIGDRAISGVKTPDHRDCGSAKNE